MSRKITVFAMNTNQKVDHNTYATTWGQVKGEKAEIARMVSSDMKIVIKQTKAVIESDDTILPDGDVTIYLFPGKVKSGVENVINGVKKTEAIAEKIFNEVMEAVNKDIQALKHFTAAVEDHRRNHPTVSTFVYTPAN